MYILYDLLIESLGPIHGWNSKWNCKEFDTLEDLLCFWCARIGRDFTQLNVTGNDELACYQEIYGYRDDEFAVVDRIRCSMLRRFLIADADGRTVNPAEMGLVPKPVPDRTLFPAFWNRPVTGAKRHRHRLRGPKGCRRTMEADYKSKYELPDGTIIDEPGIRNKARMTSNDVWDYLDGKHCARHSKSWKDQTRTPRQYRKHRPFRSRPKKEKRTDESLWLDLANDGFPVSEASMENAEHATVAAILAA